jgi:hypothetical protein
MNFKVDINKTMLLLQVEILNICSNECNLLFKNKNETIDTVIVYS